MARYAPDEPRFYLLLGANIRSVRLDRGLTQGDLAAAIGLDRSSIANIERGRQKVPLYAFTLLTEVLSQDPAELLPRIVRTE